MAAGTAAHKISDVFPHREFTKPEQEKIARQISLLLSVQEEKWGNKKSQCVSPR